MKPEVTLDDVILDYGGLWVHFSATLGQEPGSRTLSPLRAERLSITTVCPGHIAVPIPDAGVPRGHIEEARRREAEDERAARYRAAYEDLGLRVVAHPDGTLEASWRFGEAVLRNRSDESKNKHATKYFCASEHPTVQSFQPGED